MKKIYIAYIYFVVHLLVEIASFQYIYSVESNIMFILVSLAYDVLAFAPQAIIGIYIDKHKKVPIGIIGGVLMCAGLLIELISGIYIIGLILLALGNGCIHISGALATLTVCEGELKHSAIFVGGGSFGVIIGTILGQNGYSLLISIILIIIAMILIKITDKEWVGINNKKCKINIASEKGFGIVIFLAFIVVVVRAFVGYGIPLSWNKTTIESIFLFFTMGIGKILGGYLSDMFTARKVGTISTVLAFPLLIFGANNMYISLIGVAFFSMTMSITLGIIVSKLKENIGLAFGITTLGLTIGVLISLILPIFDQTIINVIIGISTIISVIALMRSLKKNSDESLQEEK